MSAASQIQGLFDAIREAASPAVWSLGVQLARRQAVLRQGTSEGELSLRVSGGRVQATVFLDPAQEEWECECDSTDDVCEHAAAAIIALRRADGEDAPALEDAPERAHLAYRFVVDGRSLRLERLVVRGADEAPLEGSIASLVRRRPGEIDVQPADLRIEETLGPRGSEPLNTGLMQSTLRILAESPRVRLDREPVEVAFDPVLPVVVVEDRGDGFVVSVRRDPAVTRVFTNGAALCSGTLRPVGEPRLTQRERDELLPGRYFPPEALHELVSEILPSLEERLPIAQKSARLPRPTRATPHLEIETSREGDSLRVMPWIVYGDPPLARLENDALRPLGDQLPVRRRDAEERLVAKLRGELGLEPGRPVHLPPEDAIRLRPALESFDARLVGGGREGFFLAPALEPDLSLDPDDFRLGFGTRVGGRSQRVDASAVLAQWQAGVGLAALPGGGFAPLPRDFLDRHGTLIADLLAARGERRDLPACALPDLARLCESVGEPVPSRLDALRGLLASFTELPDEELPAGLRASLRSYQRAGVAWLGLLRRAGLGGLLADDMGLGKTLQALCAVRGRTLVVCPTSVLYGWREQIERFLPEARVCLYHGTRRALDPEADFTLTSYALLRLDLAALEAVSWDSLVLDEAHAIKNPSSQVARAAYRLRAGFRIALTGTPIENRLEELWSQLHFLNPSLLGSRADFARRYVRPIADGNQEVAEHLKRRLRPFMLRRLKPEVALELPPRTESVLHCELSEDERAVYDAVRAAARSEVRERLEAGGSVLDVLESLLRLRQAACHPALVPGAGERAGSSAKLDVLLEALEEATAAGSRALVFSQWTALLDLVEPRLRERALAFDRLDGSTRDRGAVVERFQSADGPPVLLVSLRAGGTGLNLTAADHVFLLDPWWNPAVEDQAADRVHRIGQERPVFVHRLVALDTVEERILALQQSKRAMADRVLADAGRAASITRDELLALLD